MSSKTILSICLILICFVALSLSFSFGSGSSLFDKNDPYLKLWKRVDSCENKGLTASALTITEEIYRRSKAENNAQQLVKAVIYKMKFAQYKDEFSQEKNIKDLSAEVESARFPAKAVLQSLLADAYWQYYQSNRWKFYNRSQTINFDKTDVATFDLKALVNEVVFNYKASLQDTIALKATKINVVEEVVVKGSSNARLMRPTLFDFLAHRALDFFKNTEAGVTKAASQFSLNDDEFLKPYPEFLKHDIVKPTDSLNLTYYAVQLFRQLTSFQLAAKNNEGLADLEIERVTYMYGQSKNQLRDSLYNSTLKWMTNTFQNSSRVAEIHHLEAEWFLSKSIEYKPLESDKYKFHKKKALDICTEIIARYPKSRGAQMAANTIINIKTKTLLMEVEKQNDPQIANRVLLNYSNLSTVYFKMVKMDFFDFQKLSTKLYGKDAVTKLAAMSSVIDFEVSFPADLDYNNHAIEAKIPPMQSGYYVLLVSDSKMFSNKESIVAYQQYVVSDIAYLNKKQMNGAYDFYILNRQTGKPIKDANAQVWFNTYNYKTNSYEFIKGKFSVSDERGYVFVDGNDKNGNNFFVELTNGKDKIFSDGNFYSYKENENNSAQTRSFIFTDRSIYRPGQTIYFKSILMKSSKNQNEILPNQKVTVYFYDVNRQKIASQDLVTNDYGTISGSFTAPQGVLTGNMEITDGYGSASVSVEEYKRPKFETQFDTLKGSYKLNDEVVVKGFAKAYAGYMIDNALVKYRVVRRVNYPDWWYWYRSYGGYTSSETEISNGTFTTDDKGYFEIKFKALPDLADDKTDNPTYTYQIFVDVTDVNGETRSAETEFRVGYQSLELNVSVPEVISTKSLPEFIVSAVNLNGVEETVSGSLSIYELKQPARVFRKRLWPQPDKQLYSKEEYYKLFPNDLYADENNQYKWEKLGKAIISSQFTTGKDAKLMIDVKAFKPGIYLVEGLARDKSGVEIKSLNYITVFDPSSTEPPVKSAQWLHDLVLTVEPGKTASYIVASSYSDIHCLYDLEGDRRKEIKFISPSVKPLEILVTEADRGGLNASTHFIKFGRVYSSSQYITVPFTNKSLDITYSTFRNKLLPGQQEEWTLEIKDKSGDKVAAEMLVTMYDASLDAYRANAWNFNIYNSFYPRAQWMHSLETTEQALQVNNYQAPYTSVDDLDYDALNYFGLGFYSHSYDNRRFKSSAKPAMMYDDKDRSESESSGAVMDEVAAPSAVAGDTKMNSSLAPQGNAGPTNVPATKTEPKQVVARKNFNETAFFYPQLKTNEKGEIIIKFTIPESLTRWKFMGLAHTKDLSYGQTQNEVITQKELMVVPNPPRFFRENDQITFVSKITNLSTQDMTGSVAIKFYDAFTEQDITGKILAADNENKNFTIKKGLSTAAEWNLIIPEIYQAIKYKIVATAGNFSDGEEMVVPVLSNRMLVTESMPLPIRGNQSKDFNFTKFISQNNNSTTLKNHAFTLEFTANPAWYAVQSLPYLMEYPYECAEQTFARYYSNALASYIANSKPKIKQIFESWKSKSPESFLSNLEKNQELKALLLEETPWVLDSKNETENKKRLALMFDMNRMANELYSALNKLEKMQTSNGGWPWFSGCPEDWYITQHIVTGFAHLQKLGVLDIEKDDRISKIVKRAKAFCDKRLQDHYLQMKRNNKNYEKENNLDNMAIQYLYMRSYFQDAASVNKEATTFYKKQCQTYWLSNSRYLQGMIALSLNRYNDKKTALDIMRSLKENAINSEEMGMYWKENYGGYYWYQAPIEMQALMIEAFDEVLNDLKSVDDLKTWLIKSKQTQNWGTTRATTEAVYALLLRGSDWLTTEPNVQISLGNLLIDPKNDPTIKTEAGTGYFKKTFFGEDVKPEMGKIKVVKKDAGVSWGAVYWQYFEQLDKITTHETPLKLTKKLFVMMNTASGPVIKPITDAVKLKVGDKVKVRIELRADRDMEYVHLKDMRAAGFEPVNVLSSYRYQDGLGYYESTKDAATNFFISYLPKGNYVFEYQVVVSHQGDFSNGISQIQCMYAPEFTSHSEGLRVKIEK